MIRKWKDYFTNICDVCGIELTKDGIVYVIRDKQGICAECYDTVKIYLIDVTVDEIEIEDGNACPACSKQLTEGACISCGENYDPNP
tara:strand:- start:2805 stop:3065 length:261 start_codon:yes stop_codon:yes gene_type:complete